MYSVSTISVDLPLPETPVTQVKVPSGISAVRRCRLCSVAPLMRTIWPWWPGRRALGTGIWRKPVRYCAVRLSWCCISTVGGPHATTSPPWMPARGPMSTT